MNRKFKKFIHLIILECNTNRTKLKELWDKIDKISIKPKYSLYIKKNYQTYKDNDPSLKKNEIMKVMKEKWTNMTEEEKIPYIVVENKKPKQLSAYNVYFREQYKIVKEQGENLRLSEISKIIGAQWRGLDANEKARYKMIEHVKNVHPVETKPEEVAIIDVDINRPKDTKTMDDEDDDIYLTPQEKHEIKSSINYLRNKELRQLVRIYENNYDEKVEEVDKEKIMENFYEQERKNIILTKWNEKIKLLPPKLCELDAEDIDFLEKRQKHLMKMDYWGVYLQFKKNFNGENLPQEEMVQKIVSMYEEKLLLEKKYKIFKIKMSVV